MEALFPQQQFHNLGTEYSPISNNWQENNPQQDTHNENHQKIFANR